MPNGKKERFEGYVLRVLGDAIDVPIALATSEITFGEFFREYLIFKIGELQGHNENLNNICDNLECSAETAVLLYLVNDRNINRAEQCGQSYIRTGIGQNLIIDAILNDKLGCWKN